MDQLKTHTTTLAMKKRTYACDHCCVLGHTRIHCPKLLSGHQNVMPAKTLVPGEYPIYSTPAISKQRKLNYHACNLTEYPKEVHPDSSYTLSSAEHSLCQSITGNKIEKDYKTSIFPKDLPPAKEKSCIISQTKMSMQKKKYLITDTNYDPSDEKYTKTLQEMIESSANSTVNHARRDPSYNIFNQKYEREIGTEIESVERFRQVDPNVHLNSAAWCQGNQSSVQELIPTIDSKSYI